MSEGHRRPPNQFTPQSCCRSSGVLSAQFLFLRGISCTQKATDPLKPTVDGVSIHDALQVRDATHVARSHESCDLFAMHARELEVAAVQNRGQMRAGSAGIP